MPKGQKTKHRRCIRLVTIQAGFRQDRKPCGDVVKEGTDYCWGHQPRKGTK